jgi:hypothetical protein
MHELVVIVPVKLSVRAKVRLAHVLGPQERASLVRPGFTLDASSEAARLQEADRSGSGSNEPLARWHDASGNGHHAVQQDPTRQPRLVNVTQHLEPSDAPLWVVRFDGQDDHLRILGAGRRFPGRVAEQGGDRRRDRRAGPGDARVRAVRPR